MESENSTWKDKLVRKALIPFVNSKMSRPSLRNEQRGSDYIGFNKAVWGHIRKGNNGPDVFKIHFTPQVGLLPFGNKDKRRSKALRIGSEDLLGFLDVLKNKPEFKNVQNIVGLTNFHMARYAIEILGFHIVHPDNDTQTDNEIMEMARTSGVLVDIQISREELLEKRNVIRSLGQPDSHL